MGDVSYLGCCVDRRWWERATAEGRTDIPKRNPGCDDSTCMRLPEGRTCGDCVHVERCTAIFGRKPEDTSCDFFPRRFRLRVVGESP